MPLNSVSSNRGMIGAVEFSSRGLDSRGTLRLVLQSIDSAVVAGTGICILGWQLTLWNVVGCSIDFPNGGLLPLA